MTLHINQVGTHNCGSLTMFMQYEIQLEFVEHKRPTMCTQEWRITLLCFHSLPLPTINKDIQFIFWEWLFWHQLGKYIFMRHFRFQKVVVQSLCPTLCDPIDCSTPDSSILHYLPEFAQIHVESVMLSNHLIPCCPQDTYRGKLLLWGKGIMVCVLFLLGQVCGESIRFWTSFILRIYFT